MSEFSMEALQEKINKSEAMLKEELATVEPEEPMQHLLTR